MTGKRAGRFSVWGLLAVSLAASLAAAGYSLTGSDGRSIGSCLDRTLAAKAAFADRDYVRAEDLLQGAPATSESKLLLARILLRRGRLADARAHFETLLKEDSSNVETLRGMAETFDASGQPGIAVAYLLKAAALRKDDPELWRDLALVQKRSADSSGALHSIQQAIAFDPIREDLSPLLSELTMSEAVPPLSPRLSSYSTSAPRLVDPRVSLPQSKIPDPTREFPRPGGDR